MAVIALVSAKSGAVTCSALALALSAPKRTLLAECDPAGGTIRTGYLQGHSTAAVGLHQLATAERSGTLADVFEHHLVPLDPAGQRLLLPGLTDPAQAPALAGTWEALVRLWRVLEGEGFDVVIDAGRVLLEGGEVNTSRYPAALLRRADVVLLVLRQNLTQVAGAAPVAAALRRDLAQHGTGADALAVLLVGDQRSPSSSEITRHLGLGVLAGLDRDDATALALTHGPGSRGLSARAPLLRLARSGWEQINALATRRQLQLSPGGYASVYQYQGPVVSGG